MDYKDLIKRLNAYSAEHQCHGGITAEAADSIETLLTERDAAVNALHGAADCTSCKFYEGDHPECDNCGAFLEEWQWSGPQKEGGEK